MIEVIGVVIRLVGAFDSCKGNRLQSAFTGLHPPAGTNPRMALIYRGSSRKMLARLRRVRCKLGASIIVSSDQRNLVFSICPEVADPQSAIGRLENYPCRSPGPAQGRARCRAGPPRPGSGRGQGARRGRGQGREGKGRAKGTGRWPGSVQFSSGQFRSGQVRSVIPALPYMECLSGPVPQARPCLGSASLV